jgi:hypothetical protein
VLVTAHADDELLFQNPDFYGDINSSQCVTSIILTGTFLLIPQFDVASMV